MATAASPTTLTGILKTAAATFPSRRAVAVRRTKLEMKHEALDELVDATAARLADAGILPGNVVALSFHNTIELVVLLLAVIQARAVAAVLCPVYTQQQLQFCLADCKARFLITSAKGNAAATLGAAGNLGVVHPTATLVDAAGPVHFRGLPANARQDLGFSATNHPSDGALLHYTTSGQQPKGVLLTQANLAASVRNIRSRYGLVETDATVLVLPLFDVRSLLHGLLCSLASGASVTLGRRLLDPNSFWADMATSGATWYTALPTFHEILLDRHDESNGSVEAQQCPKLRFIGSCGAPLAPETIDKLEAAFDAPVLDAMTPKVLDRDGDVCIIVGAGPSGLAVAACLHERGVPFVVLERGDCIAPLWHKCTDDSLKLLLHSPDNKWFRKFPRMPFPDHDCPTGRHYVDYLESYAAKFQIVPEFNCTVVSARYDETSGLWRVHVRATDTGVGEMDYIGRWLVVATGETSQSAAVVPNIPGLDSFAGDITPVGRYKSGEAYRGKRVLVVGDNGNSAAGMAIALDLCDHGARAAVVARDAAVHVLRPRKATLELATMILEEVCRLPRWVVHKAVALLARVDCCGGNRERTRAGDIVVVPAVARFGRSQAEFVDGRALAIDAVVFASGCRTNVPQAEWHGERNGYPATAFPYSWDGHCGLYAVLDTCRICVWYGYSWT